MKKKEKLMEQIIELLEDNNDVFADAIEELDGVTGCLGSRRWRDMDEFNEEFSYSEPLEIADMVLSAYNFSTNDYYFRVDCGELESSDDRDYSDDFDVEEVAETLAEHIGNLCIVGELGDLLKQYDETDENEEYDDTEYKIVFIVRTANGDETRTMYTIGDEMRTDLKVLLGLEFDRHGQELKKIISITEEKTPSDDEDEDENA